MYMLYIFVLVLVIVVTSFETITASNNHSSFREKDIRQILVDASNSTRESLKAIYLHPTMQMKDAYYVDLLIETDKQIQILQDAFRIDTISIDCFDFLFIIYWDLRLDLEDAVKQIALSPTSHFRTINVT
jgi:hypothetical protein